MVRSLKVHPESLPNVRLALQRNGYPSQQKFADDIGPSLSTVKSFLNGKPVDYENFREICERLGLDWQAIAYLEAPLTQRSEQQIVSALAVSPFVAGPPIDRPCRFFGRDREIKRCFNLLKRHPLQNIAAIGQRRMGKTSFLRYLAQITTTPVEQLRPGQKQDWLPQPECYRWIFVDFQDSRMASRERLLGHWLRALGISPPDGLDLDRFMDLVSDNLHQPTIILLDEIGVGLRRCPELDDEFWDSLRSLATHQVGGNLAFVLSAPESPLELARHSGFGSPFFNIFGYVATLGPLSEIEARELVASSPIPLPEADIEWILSQSQRIPLLLQILCRERLFALENGETDDRWRAESLQQIEPFLSLTEGKSYHNNDD